LSTMRRPPPLQPPPPPELRHLLREFLSVFRYGRRALQLVWETRPALALALGVLTVLSGVLPTAAAWVGARIIDTVIHAQAQGGDAQAALRWVVLEGVLIALLALCSRSLGFTQSLLRAQVGTPRECADPGKGPAAGAGSVSRIRSFTTA
jgi:ATP-binding cassette subfamily B protein